jgi:hypothetical protein
VKMKIMVLSLKVLVCSLRGFQINFPKITLEIGALRRAACFRLSHMACICDEMTDCFIFHME